MSGRNGRGYRGSGRGHGRQGGRGRSAGQRSADTRTRKAVNYHVYQIGSAKQASDFVIVTKFLINHIRKTYRYGDDIGQALEKRVTFDFTQERPKLSYSSSTDATKKQQ